MRLSLLQLLFLCLLFFFMFQTNTNLYQWTLKNLNKIKDFLKEQNSSNKPRDSS